MKLNLASLGNTESWKGYRLPAFDVNNMITITRKQPVWLHMGAGNIFRALPAVIQQDLLEAGLANKGITVCECYDEEIVPACYTPYDNLSLLVTLKADGSVDKRVIASVAEAFTDNGDNRLIDLFRSPSLQIVSFTITEKGYAVMNAVGQPLPFILTDIENGSDMAKSIIGRVTAGLLARYHVGGMPLALLSLDNCARNGERLAEAVRYMAGAWHQRGMVEQSFMDYISGAVSYPWSMIDKITPRPSETVADLLAADGFENTKIIETQKHTFVAPFVNAEACQYLVVEDDFPSGRPALEHTGVYMTDRLTVCKTEQMKVGACLNPLHTILAISGMLLGYPTIAACTQDERLMSLIRCAAYEESLPVAAHPGIIDPACFLEEVLTERLPNPFIPDTPARIACDTSQKIPVRFGETLKARIKAGLSVDTLTAIPLFFALWLRYLTGMDDNAQPMKISPDPRLTELTVHLSGVKMGDTGSYDNMIHPILSDATIFGVDLYNDSVGLGEKVSDIFNMLMTGPGAVNRILNKSVSHINI